MFVEGCLCGGDLGQNDSSALQSSVSIEVPPLQHFTPRVLVGLGLKAWLLPRRLFWLCIALQHSLSVLTTPCFAGLCVLQVTQGHLDPQRKSLSEVCRSVQTQAKEEWEPGPLRNIFLGSRLGRLTPWGRVEQRCCRGARCRGVTRGTKGDRGGERSTVRRCEERQRHQRRYPSLHRRTRDWQRWGDIRSLGRVKPHARRAV
ncbi:uncharacterized protein LOC141952717 isoform X1 [Strix uralensis]|uniref:uncharacterized protein LOC141952717 isoform X1 n=1 Tax=Strix uralensis TaxID=36305 RepID=UPI003DA62AF6